MNEDDAGIIPRLPHDDDRPGVRRAGIARDREVYRIAKAFDTEGFAGIALAETLPVEDNFDLPYALKLLPVGARILTNHALVSLPSEAPKTVHTRLADFGSLVGSIRGPQGIMRAPAIVAQRVAEGFPGNLDAYGKLFPALRTPLIHDRVVGTATDRDAAFAWQRIAGANPMVLRAIHTVPSERDRHSMGKSFDRAAASHPEQLWELLAGFAPDRFTPPPPGVLPGWFGVTNEHFRSVMGDDDSLERAADEGRLFLADYRDFAAVPRGSWPPGSPDAVEKRIYAPLALFAHRSGTDRMRGGLTAVAIQCDQQPGLRTVFTPNDGVRWEMALTVVQCADANDHELVHHLPHTHLVMEAAILCTRRNLARNHPLRILLEPHFQYTLAINDYADHHLIAPGGDIDHIMAPTIAGSLEVVTRSLRQYRFRDSTPVAHIAERGTGKTDSALVEYPWRDDAVEVWAVIERFVRSYVGLYYDDPAVLADAELQSFVTDFSDPAEGNVGGVDPVDDVDSLTTFVATLVWTATCGHGAVNYAQFPMFGSVVNAPGALYADAPTEDTPELASSWTAMLPPVQQAVAQATILYQLSGLQIGEVGEYPSGWFHDRRVTELVTEYRRQLRLVDTAIADRNRFRWLPYPFLRPSQTGQSIFI